MDALAALGLQGALALTNGSPASTSAAETHIRSDAIFPPTKMGTDALPGNAD